MVERSLGRSQSAGDEGLVQRRDIQGEGIVDAENVLGKTVGRKLSVEKKMYTRSRGVGAKVVDM